MSRPFALVTIALTAMTAFLIGLIFSGWVGLDAFRAPGSMAPRAQFVSSAQPPASPVTPHLSETPVTPVLATAASTRQVAMAAGLVNFADVAERINPAVVNI